MIPNYVDGQWTASRGTESLPVTNPATGEELGRAPLSSPAELDAAVQAAARTYRDWRRVPVVERVQFLFKLKALLEEHIDPSGGHHHPRMRQDRRRVAR